MHRSRFSSAMIPYAIPTRKLRDCLKQNSSKKPIRKREPVQNPKLRYFKPFEFFDHTTAPRNSPAYVSAIADAVTDAKKIVNRVEKECQTTSSGM
jgi:hypothetical protein